MESKACAGLPLIMMVFSRRQPAFLKLTVSIIEISAFGFRLPFCVTSCFPPRSPGVVPSSPSLSYRTSSAHIAPASLRHDFTASKVFFPPEHLSAHRCQYDRMQPLLPEIQQRAGVKKPPPWESVSSMGCVQWKLTLCVTVCTIQLGTGCYLLVRLARSQHRGLDSS